MPLLSVDEHAVIFLFNESLGQDAILNTMYWSLLQKSALPPSPKKRHWCQFLFFPSILLVQNSSSSDNRDYLVCCIFTTQAAYQKSFDSKVHNGSMSSITSGTMHSWGFLSFKRLVLVSWLICVQARFQFAFTVPLRFAGARRFHWQDPSERTRKIESACQHRPVV